MFVEGYGLLSATAQVSLMTIIEQIDFLKAALFWRTYFEAIHNF